MLETMRGCQYDDRRLGSLYHNIPLVPSKVELNIIRMEL